MLFNTIPFFFFFSLVYFLYWAIPVRFRKSFLLFAGISFYAFSSWALTAHFLFVIAINYAFYTQLIKTKSKFTLTLAVILNLINLGFFKYFYFFNKVLSDITNYPFFQEVPNLIHIGLPLAISFYTFQVIASLVDNYRAENPKEISLQDYFLFVAFFPVLIAGPIMRLDDFLPNLDSLLPDKEKIRKACYLLMSGLLKKVLVADPMSSIISPIFQSPSQYDSFSLVMAGICYSIQVFCDFSGLTDMARSLAYFLGFEIPENFKAPFFSLSGRELWKRWHITLSFWLRDYIYFPLGGSRFGEARTYLNLIIIMTLGGFWHGADYTFICWGFYWGVILATERYFEIKWGLTFVPERFLILKWSKAFFVFFLFSISGLMFRSNSATSMIDLFTGIFINSPNSLVSAIGYSNLDWLAIHSQKIAGNSFFQLSRIENLERVGYMALALILFHHVQYYPEKWGKLKKYDPYLLVFSGMVTVFLLATLSQDGGDFIYYRF